MGILFTKGLFFRNRKPAIENLNCLISIEQGCPLERRKYTQHRSNQEWNIIVDYRFKNYCDITFHAEWRIDGKKRWILCLLSPMSTNCTREMVQSICLVERDLFLENPTLLDSMVFSKTLDLKNHILSIRNYLIPNKK